MKLVIDILMFILMLLEFSRNYLPTIIHEVIGIILLILVIIHLILNRSYIKNIFKGKYNLKRTIMLIINLGFFISFILSIIFGILTSEDLLVFLNIGNYKITNLHKIFSYISLLFLGIHLGINFNSMFNKLEKNINKYILYIIKVIVVVYGVYSFYKLNIFGHITGKILFSIKNSNIIINIIRYLCVVGMISIIVNLIDKYIKSKR